MCDERDTFFAALLARCSAYRQTCLTLTAIHPDGKRRTPSHHVPLNNPAALREALAKLDGANALDWGAYLAVGLRRPDLMRWQRGGTADVVALPALFVDVDDPSPDALERLHSASPAPSCIVHSGGGYHAYWWLDTPTADLETARRLLRGLAAALHGDMLSVAQSLRVPSTVNTKPTRDKAQCNIVSLSDRHFTLRDFAHLLPTHPANAAKPSDHRSPHIPSADLIAQVTNVLLACGCKQRGDWLNGACPFPERHKHDDQHPSFGFNIRSGYGFCHVCGTLLLRDLCPTLGIRPHDPTRREVMPVSKTHVSSRHLIR
jgi:hypothetical protein